MADVLTNTGKQWIIDRLDGGSSALSHVGIGTGSTAAAVGDTALETEVETRAAGTVTQETDTITGDTYQIVGTVSITATRAITEAAPFTASSGGTMPIRSVFSVVNLENGDSFQGTFQMVA